MDPAESAPMGDAGEPAQRRPARHRASNGRFQRVRGPLVALLVLAVAATVFVLVNGSKNPRDAAASTSGAGGLPSGSTSSSATQSPTPSASASPTATPTATPRTTPSASHAAPGPPTTSSRKGVSVWTFSGVDRALQQSGASWYYTWSTGHGGIESPSGVEFVPMIWGSGSVTDSALGQAKAAGTDVLGFNEPDMSSQSNMTVAQALDLWPKLESTGRPLGSPAVASGGADAGGWLDQFMSGATQRGYRVDFIALHWYGGDFTTSAAVSQLKSYLQAVYNRYHKPIWLTEFALINFSNGTHYPSEAAQAAFLTAATKMLDGLPYLKRYAWFALPASDTGPSTGLFRSGPAVTDVGRAFEAAR
jgi:hypothetical protein